MTQPPPDRSSFLDTFPGLQHAPWRIRGAEVDLTRVRLMGIINVTPDSFSDGGQFLDPSAAVDRAAALVEQGADLLDIGAESTRPGAAPIPEEEELRRLLPVLRHVVARVPVPVSVDTTKAAVAAQALDAGAAIINDVSGLRDSRMADVVARAGAGIVLMHMKGTPQTMQQQAQYEDVLTEVRSTLAQRLTVAQTAGIGVDRILLDPGIGFGKNLDHNLTLMNSLDMLLALGRPLLVGVSRKAFIGRLTGRPVDERVMGTAGAVAVAVMKGARVIRVHDVGPMRDVITVVEAILTGSPLAAARGMENRPQPPLIH